MPQALQCPRCHGAVSVADDAGGVRVVCPHCEQPFLTPGVTTTTNDDDDWLKLDDDPIPVTAKIPAPTNPKPTPIVDDPVLVDDSMLVDEEDDDEYTIPTGPAKSSKPTTNFFGDVDLSDIEDDFTAEIDTPVPGFRGQTTNGQAKSISPVPISPVQPPPPAKPAEPPFASEYRVSCLTCGSAVYVKASQAGKTIKCTDCYSPIKVGPPPKVLAKAGPSMDDAEAFQFGPSTVGDKRPDPFTKSAEALLAEASREEEARGPVKYDDQPDLVEWFKDVFGIFVDPGVVMHWVALSVLGGVPAFFMLSSDASILRLGLMIGGGILGGIVVSCGFAILQSVANQEDAVTEWPVFDPFAWFGQLFVALAAAGVAVVPVWVLSNWLLGGGLLSIAMTMFSVYALFPFILLSMLDMESPLVPFSAEVARSVSKCQEAWGGFYLSSGLLFAGLFLLLASLSTSDAPFFAVIAIAAVIGIAFTYFAMIGRLAYSIGQAVNDPPMVNDIDRTRPTEPDGS